ncbi:MAG: 50S ribosomal protein L30 [Gemmatimonadales bacterium]
MGRNPAVGRQGPAYHLADIPAEQDAPRIRVRQVRSGIGHPERLRRTLRALGLKGHQATAELANTASVRGMLERVRHLVEVEKA